MAFIFGLLPLMGDYDLYKETLGVSFMLISVVLLRQPNRNKKSNQSKLYVNIIRY